MAKITILGGGAWGCALYNAFNCKNNVLKIVSRRKLQDYNQYLFHDSLDAEYFVIAIGSSYLRSYLQKQILPQNSKILVATKGIEEESCAFMSDVMESFFEKQQLAYLAGPSFALEVMQKLPCALVIHSYSQSLAEELQMIFPPFIRTYIGDDVIGGEIAGAYKNVIAIAGGICEGLKLGQNARASLLARGLVEMERFGRFFGAKMKTFLGLSGAGDLFLTSNSMLSRNFRVGLGLSSGKKIDDIINELGEVAEGIKTSMAIETLRKKHKIYTPIATEVVQIINGKDIQKSFQEMLSMHT